MAMEKYKVAYQMGLALGYLENLETVGETLNELVPQTEPRLRIRLSAYQHAVLLLKSNMIQETLRLKED